MTRETSGPERRLGWVGRPYATADSRWRFVIVTDTCWVWTGATDGNGYGNFSERGRHWKAHRWFYKLLNGVLPDLELDHLCRNRSCVNPSHLEPVTHKINMARGSQAAKTHCPHGHAYDEVNTRWARHGQGRKCRVCEKTRYAARSGALA